MGMLEQREHAIARRLAAGGPDGNERLTSLTAVILIVLLAIEGVTIVFLRPLISVHLFVGLLLIPPIAVKLASTGYRFARYYSGSPAYRAKGPPPALLRFAVAPATVVTTIAVFVSGVWLLLAGPHVRHTLLPIHKVGFIVWVAFTSVHVLWHLPSLPRALRGEYVRGRRPHAGRPGRQLVLLAALLAGVLLGLLLVPDFGAWQHVRHHDG
jgi:hypothetical protein